MKIIKTFILGDANTNCYLFEENKKYYLIDCGMNINEVTDYLQEENINIEAILLTHTHYDHIAGINEFINLYPKTIFYVPKEEKELLYDFTSTGNLGVFFGKEYIVEEQPILLEETFENFFDIKYITGHSKMSAIFINHENKIIFSGDTLFQSTIGRSDLAYGNQELLIKGIKEFILTLAGDYKVYPGHGMKTTVEAEKENTYFK